MKRVLQSAFLLTMLLIVSIVLAGSITDNSFDKIMSLSGLNKQMAELPGNAVAGLEQARKGGTPFTDAQYAQIQRALEDAFRPSDILSIIGLEIKKNVSESEASDLLAWYESDVGRKITQAEERASTPAAYQEMISEARSLLADEKRVYIARHIDGLVNATDMLMQLQEYTAVAVFSAISEVLDPAQPTNIEAFKNHLSAQEDQMRANVEQLVILSLVYSYIDIDMATIEEYVTFLERANTRKFNLSAIKGMQYALQQSIDKMAKSIADVYDKEDGKK